MTAGGRDRRRRAAAHVVVDDVASPGLDEAAAHHLARVLRIRDGQVVTVTDGRGAWRVCRSLGGALEPDGAIEVVDRDRDLVTVAFAIPKLDRPEWIVQKLTELGVDRIVLLHADRSVVRWDDDRASRHVAKLRRVALEALQQSRGVWLPEIAGPVATDAVLPAAAAAEPDARPLSVTDVSVAIGPEGGWTDRELDLAGDTVSLGTTVLRVETAAIAAGALLRARS